jgi:ADP-dependent phosphofructokinase/glucokinase
MQVMSRGDRREVIVHDDADRVEFLRTLRQVCLRMGGAGYVSNLLGRVDSKL